RRIGTSCPGILEIYQLQNGAIRRVTGAWADNGQCQLVEIKDLNGDGVQEIVVRLRNYGVNADIYRWNGRQYVRSNSEFAGYYNKELEELIGAIRSSQPLPTSARVRWSEQATEIYILQKRYSDAIGLSEEVLRIIDNPTLTTPNSVIKEGAPPEQHEKLRVGLEVEKLQGKATIRHLLSKLYEAAGNLEQSQEQLKEARRLEAEIQAATSKRN